MDHLINHQTSIKWFDSCNSDWNCCDIFFFVRSSTFISFMIKRLAFHWTNRWFCGVSGVKVFGTPGVPYGWNQGFQPEVRGTIEATHWRTWASLEAVGTEAKPEGWGGQKMTLKGQKPPWVSKFQISASNPWKNGDFSNPLQSFWVFFFPVKWWSTTETNASRKVKARSLAAVDDVQSRLTKTYETCQSKAGQMPTSLLLEMGHRKGHQFWLQGPPPKKNNLKLYSVWRSLHSKHGAMWKRFDIVGREVSPKFSE